MNVPLVLAGSLALLGAAIHGAGGEILVVRRLSPGMLPSTPFGSPATTKAMIRATWHLCTIAFLTMGWAMVLAGSVLRGDIARGIALLAASTSSAFAALVLGGALALGPRSILRHPGPVVFAAVVALAWWGVVS